MPFKCRTNPLVLASIDRTKKRDDSFIRENLEKAIDDIFNINEKKPSIDSTTYVRILPVLICEPRLGIADPEKYLVAYMLKNLGMTLFEIEHGLDSLAAHFNPAFYFVRIHGAGLIDHRKIWYCIPEGRDMMSGHASNNIQYMPDRKIKT